MKTLSLWTAVALALATPALAQIDRSHTLTCIMDDRGPALAFRYGKTGRLTDVLYLEGNEQRILGIESLYDGAIVKGLWGRYSPALDTRIEVARTPGSDDRTYRGIFWPIASSQGFPVSCVSDRD